VAMGEGIQLNAFHCERSASVIYPVLAGVLGRLSDATDINRKHGLWMLSGLISHFLPSLSFTSVLLPSSTPWNTLERSLRLKV
jgi:hypothetical protein